MEELYRIYEMMKNEVDWFIEKASYVHNAGIETLKYLEMAYRIGEEAYKSFRSKVMFPQNICVERNVNDYVYLITAEKEIYKVYAKQIKVCGDESLGITIIGNKGTYFLSIRKPLNLAMLHKYIDVIKEIYRELEKHVREVMEYNRRLYVETKIMYS